MGWPASGKRGAVADDERIRYERGATLLTANLVYKQWATIFNNDATLTSALLDRLLDHVETVLIEGKSCRGQAHAEA